MYDYKTYDSVNKKWIYGELEKIVHTDLSSTYYIINNNIRFECKKENICKSVPLKANGITLYDKDIITIKFNNEMCQFIIMLGTFDFSYDYDDVLMYGMILYDIKNAQNCLISSKLNEKDITYIGNMLESELN